MDTGLHVSHKSSCKSNNSEGKYLLDNIKSDNFNENLHHDWIEETFKKKICTTFIKSTDNANICCCGRNANDHKYLPEEFMLNNSESVKWDPLIHTRELNTNAFGDVKFQCKRDIATAKYVRLSIESKPKDIMKLLSEEWKLDYPSILISIIGGRKGFKINEKVKRSFSESLSKISESTNVWFITGGINSGIMKHVGETLKASQQKFEAFLEKRRIVCIGMATWGFIRGRRTLINHGGAIAYNFQDINNSNAENQGDYLDQHHTHFLLADDGMINKYGGDVMLRSELERYIMEFKSSCAGIECIPGIQLVLEGGFHTIRGVLYSVSGHTAMPVVLIKGSGGAADLLAYAAGMDYTGGQFYKNLHIEESKNLMLQIQKIFPGKKQQDYAKIFNELMKCMKYKDNMTIYDVDDNSTINLDVAILTALLKVSYKHCSTFSILNLSMIWRQIDFAKSQIFIDGKQHKNLEESMLYALAHNHPDFVDLIIENGFNMQPFLTVSKLETLYSLRRGKERDMLSIVFQHIAVDKDILQYDVDLLLQKLLGKRVNSGALSVTQQIDDMDAKSNISNFKHPFKELFIWSILSNLPDMAMSLWKHGEEGLAKALIAVKLFKELASIAKRRHMFDDMVEGLEESGRKFGNLSVNLLEECYVSNSILSTQLIKYSSWYFGNTSCLSLAISSRHLNFVAHSCCQGLLTAKWSSPLHLDAACSWRIILSFIFPPLVLLTPFHTENEELYERMRELELDTSNQVDLIDVERKSLTFSEKYIKFFNAPVTKFWSNFCVYLVFLFLFGVIVTRKLEVTPCLSEWLLFAMAVIFLIEELRQAYHSMGDTIFDRFKDYLKKNWNSWDIVAVLLFFVGFVLRFDSEKLVESRVIYSIDIMIWIMRLLEFLTIFEQIGPHIVMIQKMTVDTAYFIFILIMFLVAYAVTRYVLLYPNDNRSITLLGESFMVSYFQIYGELFMDYPSTNNNETIFSTEKQYDHTETIVIVIMAFYLFVANILLLNLLIAIFNNTYSKVQSNSQKIWKFQRYGLLQEYIKPILNPHLIIFGYSFRFIKCCCNYLCVWRNCHLSVKRGKKKTKYDFHNLMFFEKQCVAALLLKGVASSYKLFDEEGYANNEHMNQLTRLSQETKSLRKEINDLKCVVMKTLFDKQKNEPKTSRYLLEKTELNLRETDDSNRTFNVYDDRLYESHKANQKKIGDFDEWKVHKLSRSKIYPCTNIYRQVVKDELVPWEIDMKGYDPPEYTSPMVLACPDWADTYNFRFSYNAFDGDIDRRSHVKTYDVINGLPQNPIGRTGLKGRGHLGRYGPNHKYEAVITRAIPFDQPVNGAVAVPFQFLCLANKSILLEYNTKKELPDEISQMFDLKVLEELDLTESQRGRYATKLRGIIERKTPVFNGYVDNEMNTDNAWRESTTFHFHDIEGDVLNTFLLTDSNSSIVWRWVNGNVIAPNVSQHENDVIARVFDRLNRKR